MTNPVGNLTIAISAVVGLVTGYSIAHWRLSTIFNQKSDAEIEEMRQYYLEKYSDEDTEPEVEDENIASKADSPLPESIVHPEKRVQYDKLRGRYSSEDGQPFPLYLYAGDGEGESVSDIGGYG